MDAYQYAALSEDEIRIFRILPCKAHEVDLVECSIEILRANVSASGRRDWTPSYLALSYAWGETQQDGSHLTHRIVCDGRWLPVTKHLWQGLRRVREFQYGWPPAPRALHKREQVDV